MPSPNDGSWEIALAEGQAGRSCFRHPSAAERKNMRLILVILLMALLFGGLGFAYPILWIVALVLLVSWIFGFARRRGHVRV